MPTTEFREARRKMWSAVVLAGFYSEHNADPSVQDAFNTSAALVQEETRNVQTSK